MLFAVGFIVGYIFLIDFLVDVRAPPKEAVVEVETQAQSPPMPSGLRKTDITVPHERQYYKVEGMDDGGSLPKEDIYLLQRVALQPVPRQKDGQVTNVNNEGAQQTSMGGAKHRPLKGGRSKKSREDEERLV